MLRVFHPIGQGAFYSERFENFNVVYDCGELTKSSNAERLVKNSFEPEEKIDILFISHFDSDHVNFIQTLHENFPIKRCILPLIHDDKKIILQNVYKALDQNDSYDLLTSPETFFGSDTAIIYVKPDIENNKGDIPSTDGSIMVDDLINKQEIMSDTRIIINDDWIYIPYNKERVSRLELLKKELGSLQLDYDSLKDIDYCIKNKVKIKQAYSNLPDKINLNSLFLYSGPVKDKKEYLTICNNNFFWGYDILPFLHLLKPGCIYTGDGNLSEVVNIMYDKEIREKTGTIQVPHHGSRHSFDFSFLKANQQRFVLPVSFGNGNKFGHPAQSVICNIIENDSIFIPVTENMESIFIEDIRCN